MIRLLIAAAMQTGLVMPASTLTDVTVFNADNQGNVVGSVFNTVGGDAIPNLYFFLPNGTVINPGNGASTSIGFPANSPLFSAGSGAYQRFDGGITFPITAPLGVNLFFDGAITPSISFFLPTFLNTTPSAFSPLGPIGAPNTPSPNGGLAPGANTLAFVSGGQSIKVTDARALFTLSDGVGPFNSTSNASPDVMMSFTLESTAVPEAASIVLVACGLLAIAARTRSDRA